MLSVIICTYNRDRYVYNVLKSIADGSLPTVEYEIVLVNNNSSDNTAHECTRFHQDFPSVNFMYVFEERQGLSYARNRGIQESRGNVLVYVDDDALVNKDYLVTYNHFFAKHPMVYAAGGPILPQYDDCVEPNWMSHYTRQLVTGRLYLGESERVFHRGSYPGGGNAAYRKEVFDKIGFFNVELGRKGESLIGAEEKDLFDKMNSLGIKFYYLPTAILYHLIPSRKLTNEYFDKLTYSIGVSEKYRTLNKSRGKYFVRLLHESIKWFVTIVLWTFFMLKLQPSKGKKLILFRYNVTKGLILGSL